jgi:hypothetical protein
MRLCHIGYMDPVGKVRQKKSGLFQGYQDRLSRAEKFLSGCRYLKKK